MRDARSSGHKCWSGPAMISSSLKVSIYNDGCVTFANYLSHKELKLLFSRAQQNCRTLPNSFKIKGSPYHLAIKKIKVTQEPMGGIETVIISLDFKNWQKKLLSFHTYQIAIKVTVPKLQVYQFEEFSPLITKLLKNFWIGHFLHKQQLN